MPPLPARAVSGFREGSAPSDRTQRSWLDAQRPEEERVLERRLALAVVATRRSHVASRARIHPQEEHPCAGGRVTRSRSSPGRTAPSAPVAGRVRMPRPDGPNRGTPGSGPGIPRLWQDPARGRGSSRPREPRPATARRRHRSRRRASCGPSSALPPSLGPERWPSALERSGRPGPPRSPSGRTPRPPRPRLRGRRSPPGPRRFPARDRDRRVSCLRGHRPRRRWLTSPPAGSSPGPTPPMCRRQR